MLPPTEKKYEMGISRFKKRRVLTDLIIRKESEAVDLDSMAATPTLARFEFVVTYVRTCVRGVVVLG